jgi:hypothetical protein
MLTAAIPPRRDLDRRPEAPSSQPVPDCTGTQRRRPHLQRVRELLQKRLDEKAERVKLLNFGVGGYGLGEMPALLKKVNGTYQPAAIVYLELVPMAV